MASTDKVTGARRDIFVGDIEENRPNSENTNKKLAGNIQFMIDRLVLVEKFSIDGYFNANAFDNGVGGIVRVQNNADISNYTMALYKSGSSGTSSFNCAVYDSAGAFVNNLFTTPPSISGSNGTNVVIGKDNVDDTPSNFLTNTSGHSVNTGTLALTQLLAGYILVPFIVSNGNKAYNLSFSMKLKEI